MTLTNQVPKAGNIRGRNGGAKTADVRFEIDKSDRRQKDGRRHDDAAPKFW